MRVVKHLFARVEGCRLALPPTRMHPQRGGIIQAANLAGKSNARCPSARSLVTWSFLEIGVENPRRPRG
jgi:hypothetical protein